ncbi:RP-S6 [Acanthosepion pharaonis]|uniref:Small ribosomal subunit protein bS6m n=1 Tax=Acanthosepion pharaonis TaxID=158019 RepID=A0A812CBY5_ACAPH|nr:RP-S6 [Sepia pharaonis]
MPSYQLCLVLKSALNRTELHHALRRSCETILQRQGIIRSLENMGHKPLPNRIKKYGEYHLKGRYFLVNYESSASIQSDIKEYLHRDIDVLAPNIILRKEEETYSPEFTPFDDRIMTFTPHFAPLSCITPKVTCLAGCGLVTQVTRTICLSQP